jgi:hypothetical protein
MSPTVPAEILVAATKAKPVALPLPSYGEDLLDYTSITNLTMDLAENTMVK